MRIIRKWELVYVTYHRDSLGCWSTSGHEHVNPDPFVKTAWCVFSQDAVVECFSNPLPSSVPSSGSRVPGEAPVNQGGTEQNPSVNQLRPQFPSRHQSLVGRSLNTLAICKPRSVRSSHFDPCNPAICPSQRHVRAERWRNVSGVANRGWFRLYQTEVLRYPCQICRSGLTIPSSHTAKCSVRACIVYRVNLCGLPFPQPLSGTRS
ncbi:hypothetical protein BR93DRAFT_814779 [Coniochaeta sp. PMI_546]|nr:hypothetical protein BR93DRAFT_814779 [Coniochaeta sp. PMI_546]